MDLGTYEKIQGVPHISTGCSKKVSIKNFNSDLFIILIRNVSISLYAVDL